MQLAAAGQFELRVGIGFQRFSVDAFVDHRDLRLQFHRIGLLLPLRGREAEIGVDQRQQARGVLAVQAHQPVDAQLGPLGIEMHILALGPVVELAIGDDFRLGKDRAQGQGFPPAAVADHQVGLKSLAPQLGDFEQHLGRAPALDVEAPGEGMRHRHVERRHLVAMQFDAGDIPRGRRSDRRHPMRGILRERGREIAELCGKVVVNKKDLHSAISVGARGRSTQKGITDFRPKVRPFFALTVKEQRRARSRAASSPDFSAIR